MSAGYDLVKGLKVTFKELFKKSVTDKYPKEFRTKPQRFHGRHVLNKYEDGMEKCIGCELCAGVCPAQCIMSEEKITQKNNQLVQEKDMDSFMRSTCLDVFIVDYV